MKNWTARPMQGTELLGLKLPSKRRWCVVSPLGVTFEEGLTQQRAEQARDEREAASERGESL